MAYCVCTPKAVNLFREGTAPYILTWEIFVSPMPSVTGGLKCLLNDFAFSIQ